MDPTQSDAPKLFEMYINYLIVENNVFINSELMDL